MELWLDHTGVDERGIHRKRMKPPKAEGGASIDLTPMLDVVMIMLIFFIVAGSFIHEVVIEVDRKQSSTAESTAESDTIGIQITATDEVWIRNRRIDISAVRANISRMKAQNPKSTVNIKAHNASTFEALAAVVDASREAGIHSVALSTGETSN